MAQTRWNLDQTNRNGRNPEDFSDIIDIQEETQAWIDNLKESTIDYSLSTASTKSNLSVEKAWLEYEKDIHTLDWFLSEIDKLLKEIEDIKTWISKKWLRKDWKKSIKEAKKKLKWYENQLKKKKEKLLKQKNAEIHDYDIKKIDDIRLEIYYIKEDIGIWQRWEYSNTARYPYNSQRYPKRVRRHQHYYTPTWEDNEIDYEDNSYTTIDNPQTNNPTTNNPRCSTWWKEWIVVPIHKSVDYKNMDWWETLKKWWVSWALDKVLSNFNNLTPWQRETWKNLWVLACVAWSLYWLYKFYTNKNMSLRTKAWITVWTIFGTEALLWESPLSLFNKAMTGWLSLEELQNKFGNAISRAWLFGSSSSESIWGTVWTSWESWETSPETTIPAKFTSMMIFNSNTRKGDIDKMTEEFNNDKDNKKRKFFYEQSCNKLKKEYGDQTMEYFQTIFSDKYDKEKWENRIAWFGITKETDQDEPIYWLANNAIMNEIILKKFQEENWLIVTNKDALKDYINKHKIDAIDIDELNRHINNNWKDWFKVDVTKTHTERKKDIENKEKLRNQADKLPLNEETKSDLKEALETFYDERTIESKPNLNNFSLKIEWWLLILTSHWWYKSKINLDKKELDWFWDSKNRIQFTNLSDLLNTADLSNKILESQKWKTPKNEPPFQYKWPTTIFENWIGKWWRWIYFNDAENIIDFDTRVLSGGWRWKMSEIKELHDNPEEYAKYLSDRRYEIYPKSPKKK